MKILFIQTGGTIDKTYPKEDNSHGYNFRIDKPAFINILSRIDPDFSYETLVALQKDSLDITDEERGKIYKACLDTSCEHIVITHGTDTILQTAQVLSELKDKTIVITGAFSPEVFKNSDADFNLGTAVGALYALKHGVYIALRGNVTPWDKFHA